jgi:hypothetical protein
MIPAEFSLKVVARAGQKYMSMALRFLSMVCLLILNRSHQLTWLAPIGVLARVCWLVPVEQAHGQFNGGMGGYGMGGYVMGMGGIGMGVPGMMGGMGGNAGMGGIGMGMPGMMGGMGGYGMGGYGMGMPGMMGGCGMGMPGIMGVYGGCGIGGVGMGIPGIMGGMGMLGMMGGYGIGIPGEFGGLICFPPAERTVTLVIREGIDQETWKGLNILLDTLVDTPGDFAMSGKIELRHGCDAIMIAPVTKVEDFARKIHFAKVEERIGRTIYLSMEKWQLRLALFPIKAEKFIKNIPDIYDDIYLNVNWYAAYARANTVAWWTGRPPKKTIVQPADSIPGPNRRPDVIFGNSPLEVVDVMLKLARVQPGEVVFDLGSGDGRFCITAARKYGAWAYGYEIRPDLVKMSWENVVKNKVEHLVTIERRDIYKLDLSGADIVTLYLLPSLNVKLIPQLEKMKPGSRIVSHDFDMRGIKPDKVVDVTPPGGHEHKVYLWTTPLKKEDKND